MAAGLSVTNPDPNMATNGATSTNGVEKQDGSHTPSQRYLSTRGEDYGVCTALPNRVTALQQSQPISRTDSYSSPSQFSFEEAVLKGLATDGGLYIPEEIPVAKDWRAWKDLSFSDLAFEILSLYISPAEIPPADLMGIIGRSYATFRAPETTPLRHLTDDLYLLELFHGPTFAFKDVALQFLGNLFEYFLVRKNEGKTGRGRRSSLVRR